MQKHKLDGDLKKIVKAQDELQQFSKSTISLGVAAIFMVLVLLYTSVAEGDGGTAMFVVAASVIAAYMAMNIGANDVANNIGPAVGSRALTMAGALIIAAIFEAAGALIAGGDVVDTIREGIIDPAGVADTMVFVSVMMAALLAAALWLNLATFFGAPVSTTHSIVGGVMGAGIAAVGTQSVNWSVIGKIAASWVVSPVLGGIVAACFLYFIKRVIMNKDNKLDASRTWVPVLVGLMAGVFSMYLVLKGLSKIWVVDTAQLWIIGFGTGGVVWVAMRPLVAKASIGLENRRRSVSTLFTVPLICSAALLSFAHGANDVANAIGPLAAIVSAVSADNISVGQVAVPFWVMVIGAIGIAVGLLMFGPRITRTVGEQITRLNQMRACCVASSAAITVLAASGLGLPVSSTHIVVGGVFGVGFLREYMENKNGHSTIVYPDGMESYVVKNMVEKRRLVRRHQLMTIVSAWVITVPATALLSGILYFVMSALL